jgi:hypothetical protein
MYMRFVQTSYDTTSGRRNGLFVGASGLRDAPETPQYIAAQIAAILEWFGTNLLTPTRFNRTTSKGAPRRNTIGLSWFKPTADAHLQKAHELRAMLEENGCTITILKTDRPGFIVYEDDYQIVAEPFADTPT